MIQNVIAIVVAASVCWHTVAGCCAHHDHADRLATAHLHGASARAHADADPLGSGDERCHAADHCHEADDSHGAEHGVGGCPCQSGSDCGQGSCTFAAAESPTVLEMDRAGGDGILLGDSCAKSLHTSSAFRLSRAAEGGERSSAGAPRRHITLCVLRL